MTSVHVAVTRLRESATAIPHVDSVYPLEAPTFAEGATTEEIDALETVIGVPLPAEYRDFLSLCSGIDAMDVWNGYSLHSPALVQRIVAAEEVPMQKESEQLLPVGSDGGGNMFFLTLPSGTMLKWRHDIFSSPFIVIAPSFVGFLDRIAQDWARFVEGDSTWDYLAG